MERFKPLEILLAEMIIYILLWMINDYLATLLSLIFGGVFLLILLISLVVELVERSKVPRWYFWLMLMSVLAPLFSAVIFLLIRGGLEWMTQ